LVFKENKERGEERKREREKEGRSGDRDGLLAGDKQYKQRTTVAELPDNLIQRQ
jgi:hypothetical protein